MDPKSTLIQQSHRFFKGVNRESLAIVIYTFIVTVTLFLAFNHAAYDDPFITYRYAQNLASGLGFVYNPSQHLQSTTTPLFALLLAVLSPLSKNLPSLANFIGAFSLAWGGISFWQLGRSWKTPSISWVGLLLYPTFPLLLATLGSETPLYLAFCLAAFAFYERRSYGLAAVFAGLGVLTRPDGLLVPALLALDYLLRRRRPIPWKAIFIFLGLTIPWFIFAWAYFGSPLPATLAAKQHQGAMVISQRFASGFLTIAGNYAPSWIYQIEALLAFFGLGVTFWLLQRDWRSRRWLFFLSWGAIYFVSFSILGVSRYFWYYAPLAPAYLAACGIGIAGLLMITTRLASVLNQRQSGASVNQRAAAQTYLPSLLGLSIVLVLMSGQIFDLQQLRQRPDRRFPIYQAAGSWLQGNSAPDATVAALEIGILGYYARRSMIDFAGLLQPDIARQLTAQTDYQDAADWAVQHYHPNYLALFEGHFPQLESTYVAQNCQLVKQFSGSDYNYPASLNIYACRQ